MAYAPPPHAPVAVTPVYAPVYVAPPAPAPIPNTTVVVTEARPAPPKSSGTALLAGGLIGVCHAVCVPSSGPCLHLVQKWCIEVVDDSSCGPVLCMAWPPTGSTMQQLAISDHAPMWVIAVQVLLLHLPCQAPATTTTTTAVAPAAAKHNNSATCQSRALSSFAPGLSSACDMYDLCMAWATTR